MIRREDIISIGMTGKAHGLAGEITLNYDADLYEPDADDCLLIETEGIVVPFFIERVRPKTDGKALVKLEGVDTEAQARELVNCEVFRERTDDDEELSLVGDYEAGYTLVDAQTGKEIGEIDHIDDETANLLFVLTDGTLIPASEELINKVDTEQRLISMNLPEGLLDL